MVNLIKTKWLKAGMVLCSLIAVSVSVYYFSFLPHKNKIAAQQVTQTLEDCSRKAGDFKTKNDPTAGYASSYSQKYHQCFIELLHHIPNDKIGGLDFSADIRNVDTGSASKIYSEIKIQIPKGMGRNYSSGTITTCHVGDIKCTSYEQFIQYIKNEYSSE